MREEDPTKRPADPLVEKSLRSLRKDHLVVTRRHVKSWHAWLIIGLVAGAMGGVTLMANQNGKINKSKARRESVPTVSPSTSPFATGLLPLGIPFGSNNAYLSDGQETDIWLKDLGLAWISDHLPRRDIEKPNGRYDFGRIDGLLQEYGAETRANAWFIINIESKLKFGDGKEIPGTDKFVPNGPVSYAAYEEFLEVLVTYVNGKVVGWKPQLWSIDNEHSALYLPAFCGPRDKDKDAACAKKAAEAYAELVERSHNVIRRLDPQVKIVFGGPASGSPREDHDLYYKQALIALRAKHPSGYFDFFDYHNFNYFEDYQHNMEGLGITYFRALLADAGFKGKPIIIKAGGTHSGKDELSKNKRLHTLQTEGQQAAHEFKRLVWHAANGAALILRDTGKEDPAEHATFSYHGLRYNGIPRTCNPLKEQPCPDPGDGTKKLSYYTYKFLIEKLKGSAFADIKTIPTGVPNVHLYEFKKEGTATYVAWWDYFKEPSAGATKQMTITLPGIDASSAKVTDAIPAFGADFQAPTKKLSENDYPEFFHSSMIPVINDTLTLTLSKTPVYVEASNPDPSAAPATEPENPAP